MKHPDPQLAVPLYVKGADDMPWPHEEGCFHLLTADGLFICRNNGLFSSSVPAENWPASLGKHRSFCRVRYPRLPRLQFELIIGFFSRIADLHGSEACVLLALDRKRRRYHLIVPPQVATVSCSSTTMRRYPIGVRYDVDANLPAEWTIVGSVHSHVDEEPFASSVDAEDERYRAGLHIIVGCINDDPPKARVALVVDGRRFQVPPEMVLEGYKHRRRKVPQEWIHQVRVEVHGSSSAPSAQPHSSDHMLQWPDDDVWRRR